MKKNIWVLMETGKFRRFRGLSLSLLNDCRVLVNSLGGALTAVAFFDDAENETVAAGICETDHLLLTDAVPADPAAVLAELTEKEKLWAILAVSTVFAEEWLPQAAARLNTGSASGRTDFVLDAQKDYLAWTRPVLGESALRNVVCIDHRPQIGTVRLGGGQRRQRNGTAPIQVIRFTPPAGGLARIRVLGLLQELSSDGIGLGNTEVIVSGDKGVGGSEGFAPLHELAAALGGAVGVSCTTVNRGWISKAHRMGQTSHTAVPKLYVACGISGAVQHLADMLGSGIIVAVDTGPDARIFRYADCCVVKGLFEVVPAFTCEILFHHS